MATRVRAAGEGTVYKNEKMNRWEGQFSYQDPATGETKRKKITGSTQKEVAAAGKKFLKSIEDGLLPEANKITLWDWVDRWLTDYIKPNVRIKSYEKYETTLRCYIKPTLGTVIITKLKSPDIQRVLNELLVSGGAKGKGVSSTTVRITRRYLIMSLDKAVKVGMISRNVAKETDPPRLVTKEITPLTAVQAELLIKTAKEGEYMYHGVKQRQKPTVGRQYLKVMAAMAVELALGTGMRLGECFGLKWDDIDFERNSVSVQRALVTSATKGMIFEEPKTKSSKRKIPVTEKLIKALERYRKEQQWFAHLLGDKFNNIENLVLTNWFGTPMDTVNFTNAHFKRMIAYAGMDKSFSFHDLRHTHATLLLNQGVNIKVISERLGHTTINMTLNTYSHVMPDMQEQAVRALEKILI